MLDAARRIEAMLESPTIRSGRMTRPIVRPLGGLPHPVELYPAFRDLPYPALLDSAMPHRQLARYSYLMADPFLTMACSGRRATLVQGDTFREVNEDPFLLMRRLLRRSHMEPAGDGMELPPFQGGAVGYLGYDLGRQIERLPARAAEGPRLPDLVLAFYDWALAHDNLTGQSFLFSTGLPEADEARAQRRAGMVMERLESGAGSRLPEPVGRSPAAPVSSNFTHEQYLTAVRRAQQYLAAGDIYQVNISQRLEVPWPRDTWTLYRRLRETNPAPFAAYLGFPQARVLSASPEQFLRLEGSRVETRPIKGTRPRADDPRADRGLAEELVASEKERAENVMIVDLLRNDLGRVCRTGSVRVPHLFRVEAHPKVWHLVSTVAGELASGRDFADLLRASFPGGSVTGAPKIRAMEIIEELEPVRRGIYCGAIGYFSFSGDMNTSIVIRTIVEVEGRVYLQVGGAVMADSDPEAEYEETWHKARGLLDALGQDG